MGESLIIGEQIELIGTPAGPVVSANPACAGATFWLQTGYDLSAPQPTTDIVGSLLLDGERPFGYRASNRTITLPIEIGAPDFKTLAAAREVLLQEIDQQTWSLRWTRDTTGPYAGTTTAMPMLFDCYRAQASVWAWGGIDSLDRFPVGLMTITFEAAPYTRTDLPVTVDFQSPLAGVAAPPASVTLDSYAASGVPGNWLNGDNAGFNGSLGGWAAMAGCTAAVSAAQAHSGPRSMALTATGTVTMDAAGPGNAGGASAIQYGLPVIPNQSITVAAWFRTAVTARQCTVGARFYDVNGSFINPGGLFWSGADSAAAWFQQPAQAALPVYGQIVAPAGAAYAVPMVRIIGPVVLNEVHYVDDVEIGYSFTPYPIGPTLGGGTSAEWDPAQIGTPDGIGQAPSYTNQGLSANLMPNGWVAQNVNTSLLATYFQAAQATVGTMKTGDQFQWAHNWLLLAGSGSTANSGFEGSIGTWVAQNNCAVADSAVQAHTGSDSLAMTSTAAGDMEAIHTAAVNAAANGLAVTPGQVVRASAWFRSAVSARTCQMGVAFYDAAGGSLGAVVYGPNVTDATTGWVLATDGGLIVAPAFAAFAIAFPAVRATGAGAEVHYIDDVVLGVPAAQIYTVTTFGQQSSVFLTQQVNFTPGTVGFGPTVGDWAVQVGPTPSLAALTFYAGFGSNQYYQNWARLGGRVTFAFTLTDVQGNITSFSRTVKCAGGNSASVPVWNRMRVPIPPATGFNFTNVAGYTIRITNRGTADLRYTQFYINSLLAVPPPTPVAGLTRGVVYDLAGTIGRARAPISLQVQIPGTQSVTRTLRTQGGGLWTCPPGCTTVSVYGVGGGGGGGLGTSGNYSGGGGGAGSAFNAAVGVTPGLVYNYSVGVGGAGGSAPPNNNGGNGTATTFTGDSVTVTAPGGTGSLGGATDTGGAAGAAGTGGFAGAAGGLGDSGVCSGGGGSSGGSAAGGNVGATGAAGGAGGAAVAGGGAGGHGGSGTYGNGQTGRQPGGGGGGGGVFSLGGAGGAGELILIYNQAPQMQSLVAHKPPVTAPGMMSPFVSPGISDVPDGTTEYPMPTLVPGVNARFGGTYTVVAAPYSWNTPASSRTLTITVKQYEQAGGASYSSSVAATFTPSALPQLTLPPAGTGYVIVGEITLPVQDLPQDNLNAYYTVTVTDTNTSDRFMDVMFLDTMGSTVIIQSPTGYQNLFLDEPGSDRDLGLVMGSAFDRPDAISILDRAMISGGPLFLDPDGNHSLLVYSMEGAPSLEMTYHPRWWMDRYQ